MDPVSLKWNNHNSSLVNSLDHFKAVDSFVDVTLVCEGHTVKAHKIILSAGSNVLRRLLLANPAKHPILILTETKYDTLRLIIDFLYKGRVDVPRGDLQKVLQVATTFEINDLKTLCKESLDSIRSKDVRNSHPILSGSSPKKKRQRRRSSDSDILFEDIVLKKEISSSPCRLEQPEVSPSTDTLPRIAQTKRVEFCPHISDARSVLKSSTRTYSSVQKFQKDASSECSGSATAPTELFEYHPQILDSRIRISVEPSTGSDSNGSSAHEFRKDASTECDIQSLKKLCTLVPLLQKPAKSKLKHRFTEISDDSEPDTPNDSEFLLKRKRSTIWNHFNLLNKKYAACKLCWRKLSYKTNVTNLTKHLQKKHNKFRRKSLPNEQMFKDQDVYYIEDESGIRDNDHLEYEEGDAPSTSTPCILKIT